MSQARSAGSFWRSRGWRVGRFVAGLVLAAFALYELNGQRDELLGASDALSHLRVGWLLVAIAAEVASYVSFGLVQRRLLRCGGVSASAGTMTGISMATAAIADSIPGGPAFSSVYAFRQYRRRGADDALAGWTLLAAFVCMALALALFATAGVLLEVRQGSSYDLIGVVLGVLVVSALADAVVWQRRWVVELAVYLLRLSRRVVGWPRREAVVVVNGVLDRLATVQLRWRDLGATILFGLGNWAYDCACLAFSFLAVGAPVPWHGLLLAYGAGQLAANLPITPGGLGVVEGSLTVAIVAFGGAELSTVAAVLCYRVISFWGFLPVGWGVWAVRTWRHRQLDRRAATRPQLLAELACQQALAGGPAGGLGASSQGEPAVGE